MWCCWLSRRERSLCLGSEVGAPRVGKSNRRSHCFGPSEGSKPGGSIDDVFGFLRINSGVMVAVNSLDIGERAVITGSVASSEHVGFNPETRIRNCDLRKAIKFLIHSNIFWDDVIS